MRRSWKWLLWGVVIAVLMALTYHAPTGPVGHRAQVVIAVVHGSSHVTGVYPSSCSADAHANPRLQVRACTPGAIRDDVDPNHLELTVCKPHWSDGIRPPTSETNRLKTIAMMVYGVPASLRLVTELDHKIPEVLGGASDALNLWPEISDEPGKGFHNSKDGLEIRVHAAVCSGRVSLRDAQEAFAIDWTTAAQRLHLTD